MEKAPLANKVIETCEKANKPIPADFINPPTYDVGQQIYIQAWLDLDKERERSTERVFPITRRMVMDWLEWHNMSDDPEFKDTLLQVVQEIDALYLPKELSRLNARKKREASKEKRRAKRSGR